ncbi:MAG: P1 family peptidase [Christensenellales bacterium]|jgi:L-aminopeptidase/D-esterase-like protein
MFDGYLTDVEGVLVGHAQNRDARTGCSVVLCPKGAVAGVDVRGGAPGTRETDVLRQGNLVERIHGVLLAGGSAFGLDAAGGVMRCLEQRGVGLDVGVANVPIVCGAVLFDLAVGDGAVRPDGPMGYAACEDAFQKGGKPQGAVGAGTGATVGKAAGAAYCMRGGLGSASLHLSGDVVVSAIAAVNALGDVVDYRTGEILAGARRKGEFLDLRSYMISGGESFALVGGNTTIGVVATNAALDKGQALRLATVAQDGLALSIRPVHTLSDGDTVFSLATGTQTAELSGLYAAAPVVMAQAITNAIWATNSQQEA